VAEPISMRRAGPAAGPGTTMGWLVPGLAGFGGLALLITLSWATVPGASGASAGSRVTPIRATAGQLAAAAATPFVTPLVPTPAGATTTATGSASARPVSGEPARGAATAYGCAAALAYLKAYAAPHFTLQCPGSADGHQASTTCTTRLTACDGGGIITIADPCPAAYMNEASNSWVLIGALQAPIDPYGYCN
jgi:hypothetical protein